jgi:hypothetical protein
VKKLFFKEIAHELYINLKDFKENTTKKIQEEEESLKKQLTILKTQ